MVPAITAINVTGFNKFKNPNKAIAPNSNAAVFAKSLLNPLMHPLAPNPIPPTNVPTRAPATLSHAGTSSVVQSTPDTSVLKWSIALNNSLN